MFGQRCTKSFFGGDRDLSFLWLIHFKDVNDSPVTEILNRERKFSL